MNKQNASRLQKKLFRRSRMRKKWQRLQSRQTTLFQQVRAVFAVEQADLIIAALFVLAFLLFVPVFTYAYFAQDLVSSETIMNKNDTGIVLYDRYNQPFFTFYQAQPKTYIPLSVIPKHSQQAVIAMEDKDFYSHPGFSVRSIARALWEDLLNRNLAYGGSTLTQQLVKNSLLTPRKDFLRKYQEIVLASEIERRYSKDQILEMYLNSVYFGEGAFGIEEAAKVYFDKPAKNLDLAESCFLAALLPAPSALSPFRGDLNAAQERQSYILEKMTEQGFITEEQKNQAREEKLAFHPPTDPINSRGIHFALLVRDELIKKYGEEQISRTGLRVKTTIDLTLQDFAEKAVANQVARLAPNNVSNGAAVIINPKTGEILALVGSKNWYDQKDGKVNVATSLRQPGSSFKPIYYSAALEKGIITPATILMDQPTTFPGGYRPRDYDNKFRGPVTVRRALSNSLNVPSVQVLSKLGVGSAVEQAQNLGITSLEGEDYGLSLALGAGEVRLLDLTNAYATFANEGQWNPATDILEIKDKNNQQIFTYQVEPRPVLSPQASFLISSILSDNNSRAEVFGNVLNISRPAAVKTGTSENYRDSLTLGYTPSLVVGVWVGNNSGASMDNVAGSLGAAPIWKAIMEYYLAGTPIEQFTPPTGIVSLATCTTTAQPTPSKRSKETPTPEQKKSEVIRFNEYFIQGTQPRNLCPGGDRQQVTPSRDKSGQTPFPSPSTTPTPPPSITPSLTPTPRQNTPTPTITPD